MADSSMPAAGAAAVPQGKSAGESAATLRYPWFAFAALLIGNICLAFGALLVRFADTGPVAAGFWRLAIAAPALLLIARRMGQPLSGFPRRIWWMIVAGGLFFALDLASWHLGIVRTKLANATLFGNSASLLLVVWGIVVLRQMPRRIQVFAILLALAGGALLMGHSFELSPRNLAGDLLSLLAGILYTGYLLSLQRARGAVGSWSVLAISTLASLPALLAIALAMGERIMPHDWMPLIALALSSQIVGQGLLVYALPHFRPLVLGIALLVQPAIAGLAGLIVFGEAIGPYEGVGMLGVALALVLVRWPERNVTRNRTRRNPAQRDVLPRPRP